MWCPVDIQRTLGHAALGALAGVAGTAAMDLLLYGRYRRAGGEESLWQ
jgi:hypothetical protein